MATTATQHLPEPRLEDMRLEAVLAALSDPVRLFIVRTLAATDGDSRSCGSFGLSVSKSTGSHHFRVLREAGVIRQHDEGRHPKARPPPGHLGAPFPGLLDSIVGAR